LPLRHRLLHHGRSGITLGDFHADPAEDFRNRMIRLFGHAHLTTATRALDEASQRISQYLLMQALVNVCFGISLGLGLYVIGVPFSFVWAFSELCCVTSRTLALAGRAFSRGA